MERRTFVRNCALWSACSGWLKNVGWAGEDPVPVQPGIEGIRRLSREKSFTMYHSGLAPAYKVKMGELVLVECQHGLPGLVTRGCPRSSAPPKKYVAVFINHGTSQGLRL